MEEGQSEVVTSIDAGGSLIANVLAQDLRMDSKMSMADRSHQNDVGTLALFNQWVEPTPLNSLSPLEEQLTSDIRLHLKSRNFKCVSSSHILCTKISSWMYLLPSKLGNLTQP